MNSNHTNHQTATKNETIYQLVKTPAITFAGGGKFRSVYSILALEKDGDNVRSDFIYDISRTGKTAREILEKLQSAHPELPVNTYISEIL